MNCCVLLEQYDYCSIANATGYVDSSARSNSEEKKGY